MRFLLLIYIFSLTIACRDKQKNIRTFKQIRAFELSYDNVFSSCFSIKFTQGDTVFVRQHFAVNDTPQINTTYYAVISNRDKSAIDSIIGQTNYFQYDSLYYQSYEDGMHYQFCFENDSIRTFVRVHSDSVPMPLRTLALRVLKIKERLVLHETERVINFQSAKNFLLPKPTVVRFKEPETY